jgi:hypothetical protein
MQADKDLSNTFSVEDYKAWLTKFLDIENEGLLVTEVLIIFDLLEEPNLLPDRFVDGGYVDDLDFLREQRRSAHCSDDTAAEQLLEVLALAKARAQVSSSCLADWTRVFS